MQRSFLRLMILLLLLNCCAFSLRAQQYSYTLKGFMGVQGGESFTYTLQLKDSVRNLLCGYAYTYLNEKNDVKAYVVAEVDRQGKTLRLKETNIIHNNYFKSKATICLVDALLTYSNAEKSLSGPLITKTAILGAECSKGSISFTNAGELDQLFNPVIKHQELPVASVATPAKPKAVKVIYDTLPKPRRVQNPPPANVVVKKTESITEGKDKTYIWQSNDIVLEIWDGTQVDNDRVTILFNGSEVLKGYTLSKERKKLTLPIGGNELNIITIIADNEGGDPPNTADILLSDGDVHYDVIAHNTVGKRALIKIRKKQ